MNSRPVWSDEAETYAGDENKIKTNGLGGGGGWERGRRADGDEVRERKRKEKRTFPIWFGPVG